MSRVLCIPDIHLKSWMLESADTILASRDNIDNIVILGDLVDNWGHENDRDAYNALFDAVDTFDAKHPDALWCWGNHDFAYRHFGHNNIWCSGRSEHLVIDIYCKFKELEAKLGDRLRIIQVIDDVVFSHAGLSQQWIKKCKALLRADGNADPSLEDVIDYTNTQAKPEALWSDQSPLWMRPNNYGMTYLKNTYQITGHTPVEKPTLYGQALVCDVFSTYRNGDPIGNQCFVLYNTDTHSWEEIPASGER